MPKHPTKKEPSDSDDIFFSFKTLRDEIGEETEPPIDLEGEEEVINIYHQNMPKKLERKSRKGLKIFLSGLLILIISAGIFYYYGKSFFTGVNIFTGDNVKLSIEGISEVSAGEKITYVIKYENLEKIDLADAIITVNYPQDFVYEKSRPLPTDANNDTWDLGYIRSEKSGQIEITGSLIGEDEKIEKLGAKLSYHMGSDKSEGKQEAEMGTKITSSVLSLDISGPSQLLGNDVEYKIKYSNNSNEAIEDIEILAEYPKDFIFDSAEPIEPQKNSGDTVWLVNSLAGGQSKELIIKGKFKTQETQEPLKSNDSEFELSLSDTQTQDTNTENVKSDTKEEKEKILKVQIGILNEDEVFFSQAEKEFKTTIASGDIAVSLKLNGEPKNSIVNLDNVITYTVDYANKSGLNFQDVKIKLIINSNILDWTDLKDESGGVVQDEEIINGMLARSITWEIDNIKEGDEGSYTVKINTKPYSKLDKTNSLDLKAEARTRVIIGEIDGNEANKIIENDKITAQVNTELNLDARADLKSENEYEIVWQLTNTIHEVENVKVEAVLPDEVVWSSNSSVSAGDIYFDPETKQVSWQLNRIPVGIDIPLVAKFSLKTTADGRPKLLTNLALSAKDKVTGSPIISSFSDIMGK